MFTAVELESALPSLKRHASRMARNICDPEDLLQDTLLKAWKAREQFSGEVKLATWVTAIMANEACQKVRTIIRHKRSAVILPMNDHTPQPPDPAPDPEQQSIRRERVDGIRLVLATYKPEIRQAVFLFAAGTPYSEPKQKLRASRAVHKLQRIFHGEAFPIPRG
jgi:RNA polymerase sigma factor (sigma-70 family)